MKNNMTTTVINSNSGNNSNNDNKEAKEAKIIVFKSVKKDPSGYPYFPNKYEDIFFREILDSDRKKVLDYEKITKEEANRIRKRKNKKK
jgi:hypothetical protein